MRRSKQLESALDKLGREFNLSDKTIEERNDELIFRWNESSENDIKICVFKGKYLHEPFHRQNYFFINYAYNSDYQALSVNADNLITIRENECYISQPCTGYAIRYNSEKVGIIIGVLIRRDALFRGYLQTLYTDSDLFKFFVEHRNKLRNKFIRLNFNNDHTFRTMLELMVIEYANRRADTENILRTMLQTVFLKIARQYRLENVQIAPATPAEKIMQYMAEHADVVTLKDIAAHFSYNPNYVSALLRRQTGKTFSEIILERRMERAVLLMQNTELSLEEIAAMLGYNNNSNFYKAFREHYGMSPREYVKQI